MADSVGLEVGCRLSKTCVNPAVRRGGNPRGATEPMRQIAPVGRSDPRRYNRILAVRSTAFSPMQPAEAGTKVSVPGGPEGNSRKARAPAATEGHVSWAHSSVRRHRSAAQRSTPGSPEMHPAIAVPFYEGWSFESTISSAISPGSRKAHEHPVQSAAQSQAETTTSKRKTTAMKPRIQSPKRRACSRIGVINS